MGRVKRKNAFEHAQNAHSDHPAQAQSNIRAFALHLYIPRMWYPIILFADSEGPDQTAKALADLRLRCPHLLEDTFSHGVAKMAVIL